MYEECRLEEMSMTPEEVRTFLSRMASDQVGIQWELIEVDTDTHLRLWLADEPRRWAKVIERNGGFELIVETGLFSLEWNYDLTYEETAEELDFLVRAGVAYLRQNPEPLVGPIGARRIELEFDGLSHALHEQLSLADTLSGLASYWLRRIMGRE